MEWERQWCPSDLFRWMVIIFVSALVLLLFGLYLDNFLRFYVLSVGFENSNIWGIEFL